MTDVSKEGLLAASGPRKRIGAKSTEPGGTSHPEQLTRAPLARPGHRRGGHLCYLDSRCKHLAAKGSARSRLHGHQSDVREGTGGRGEREEGAGPGSRAGAAFPAVRHARGLTGLRGP